MSDGLSGRGGSGPEGAAVPGHLSMLLQELARAPGEDLHRAWGQRLQPGEVVGRFEILREIGRGGFGVVYEALDRQLGRSVAFKTLRPARTGHELSADWILKEAEAVARLDHPAIVTLYDVGRCESGPYLVEELLGGHTLEQRLLGGPLQEREAVAIAVELARGLAHAHGRGVLHRDLKPGNVFLTEDGRVKLLDFGLAHLLGTRGVQGVGTQAYMAPEQLRGAPVDTRADVFALGATLFEALAGRAPFEVKEGRSAVLDEGPPPMLPRETAAPLARLLERCLSRNPANRPANGQAVMEELVAVGRALDRAGLGGSVSSAGNPAGRKLRLALVFAGAATIVAGGAYLVATHGRSSTEPATALPAPPSIAVLAFADMSALHDQEYFADGVAEEILNALSRVDGLRVIGRTSSFAFKGKGDDLRTIAGKLDVGNVLEGSVRKQGDRVRVTVQLVRASDGADVWSESYDRELKDIFAIQDDVARSVAAALRVALLPGRKGPAEPQSTSPEAYSEYLLGRYNAARGTRDGFARAIAAYERAIALDPRYAPAWAGLANALFWQAAIYLGASDARAVLDRSGAATDRAIALAPDLADGYLVRGQVRSGYRWDWEGARADFERAVVLKPGSSWAQRRLAVLFVDIGRSEDGVRGLEKAVRLDPLDQGSWNALGSTYVDLGQMDRARRALQRALAISPRAAYPLQNLADIDLLEGRLEEALAVYRTQESEVYRLQGEAMVFHSMGREAESRRALAKLESAYGDARPTSVAEAHAWRGDRDGAFRWLERAAAIHDVALREVKTDRYLRSLRGDPRYAALLRRMNLPVD